MHYGLTLTQVRILAFQYAKLKCKFPESWETTGSAGIDWANGFRKRNETLSLRKPGNTSAARAFGFNKTAVTEFFENYESVLTKYKFQPDRILNLDETGITTVNCYNFSRQKTKTSRTNSFWRKRRVGNIFQL